jgi:phosphoribosyl 1,2-cyclic phosphate phosphodiesterase
MNVTILGSGGGLGIPNLFCQCVNCNRARQAGGKDRRNGPAVLINEDLLIDAGPDVINSVRRMGLNLSGLRVMVITHRHSDHIDPWFFWARCSVMNTDLPLLTVYAPADVLDDVFTFYAQRLGWDAATFQAETRTAWRPVQAGSMKLAGRYKLHFFAAAHGDDDLEAVLVGVQDVRAGYFHGYDSGPLPEDTWTTLARHRFDVVALDACIGLQDDYENPGHMTAAQTIETAERMREAGILKPDGTALATHIVHQAPGSHADLVAHYEPHGVTVAYDGLVIAVGEDEA